MGYSCEEPIVPMSFVRPISTTRFGPMILRHVNSLSYIVNSIETISSDSSSVECIFRQLFPLLHFVGTEAERLLFFIKYKKLIFQLKMTENKG